MIKELLKQQLTERYGAVMNKLSPKALEALLDKLAPKVDSEDKIKDFVDGLNNGPISFQDFAEITQAEADRRARQVRNTLEKEYDLKPKNVSKDVDGDPAPAPADPQDFQAAVNKAVQEALKPLTQQLQSVQLEGQRATLKAALKAKGVDESWADDVAIGTDFDLEATVERIKGKWDKAAQIAVNKALEDGQVQRGSASEATPEIFKEFAKQSNPLDGSYNIQKFD